MLRSKLQWFVAFACCILLTSYFHNGQKINGVIWSDQEGYYVYLQAFFIDGFDGVECTNGCYNVDTPNGSKVFTKYTYGVALLESPFFLTAHALTSFTNYPKDGRSLPYIWSIMIAAIFYLLIGLHFLSKLLREEGFDTLIQWIVPLGILLGTNLFYYTFRESGMSHVYSFSLMSILLYSTRRRLHSNELIWLFASATSLALLMLIRPTNAIAFLIPILWNLELGEIPQRVKSLLLDYKWILVFCLAIGVFFAPQIAYWKMISGEWLYYSYNEEGFSNWNSPKMLQVLFSSQNGWLVYSPIMILGVSGLFKMALTNQRGWLMPAILLTVATYVFGSWWAWWFGGAYGHRCFVDFLPILAIPSAIMVQSIMKNKLAFRIMVVFCLIAVFVNIRMCDFYQGMWDGPDWTWANYFQKLKMAFYLY